jgi:peptide/nickel transport system ATP-binding protein
MNAALEFSDVSVTYATRGARRPVLRDIAFAIAEGEAFGLVGESGCGKSTAAYAALRALPPGGSVTNGVIRIDGKNLAALTATGLRHLRSNTVSIVYQDPARALNPSLTIARQLTEVFNLLSIHGKQAAASAESMLARMRIDNPARVMCAYPHQLSGGMAQRVVIAMALAKNPKLLILDEPTTGLDATVEASVLNLVADLRREFSTALLFISHNLPLVARICDRIGVLYAGSLVEQAPATQLLRKPLHPYTAALLRCRPAGTARDNFPLPTIEGALPDLVRLPPACVFAPRCKLRISTCETLSPPPQPIGAAIVRCHRPGETTEPTPPAPPLPTPLTKLPEPLVKLENIGKSFNTAGRRLTVLRPLSLVLYEGETLGLVGESGSGKTTLARVILGLTPPDPGGTIQLAGQPAAARATARTRAQKKTLQIIFQNPDSALNRAHTVRHILARPLIRLANLSGAALVAQLRKILALVRLTEGHLTDRPKTLSGGLKQRVAIARALAGGPQIVVCDEPTSALDVSVQAAILNLLVTLRNESRIAYLLISHDLAVIRFLADRIAVMYRGRIVQLGAADAVLAGPHHPYTATLLAATSLPPPAQVANTGCVFQRACTRKFGTICETNEPTLPDAANAIRCHIPIEDL